ncbi:hypothetical protein TNCT_84431 [Trichonephila clavata]|uniref:Uncharacterized protein n=1 Tax=Trichonephila clavata TaxID=2740835 RepID=A0A8X6K3Y2_TRICU|nr:hypothetical protein TNCT_84431 [Trichonephila clavata]
MEHASTKNNADGRGKEKKGRLDACQIVLEWSICWFLLQNQIKEQEKRIKRRYIFRNSDIEDEKRKKEGNRWFRTEHKSEDPGGSVGSPLRHVHRSWKFPS